MVRFVYRLAGATVERRSVETGNSSITRFQVTAGLNDGDAVALPTEGALKPGDRVKPVFP